MESPRTPPFTPLDHQHMTRALRLARRGWYTAAPNPRVGCVLVREQQVVGEGHHHRAGMPHAEPIALDQAGDAARDSTAYVTLEPCCHHGRTPPCSDRLIAAGVARVVCAMLDPNPQVAGRGLAQLRDAGIETASGLLEPHSRDLNPGFIQRMTHNRPWVRCKLAMSLDGRTAMASGESKWITDADARRDVHRLRAQSAAILTGIGTLLADDPAMDVRLAPSDLDGLEPGDDLPTPMRVVLDSHLRSPQGARMLSLPGRTLILHRKGANPEAAEHLTRAGAELVALPTDHGRIRLQAVLKRLADEQINEVLLESGPTLAGSALQEGLIDELILYVAPHLMGSEARGVFNLPSITRMAERIDLKITELRQVGESIRITAAPSRAFRSE